MEDLGGGETGKEMTVSMRVGVQHHCTGMDTVDKVTGHMVSTGWGFDRSRVLESTIISYL